MLRRMFNQPRLLRSLTACALVSTLGAAALAQEEGTPVEHTQRAGEVHEHEQVGPNTGRVSLAAGVDFASAYFFRGIGQENQDLIVQPWGTLAIDLYQGQGAIRGATLSLGIWNSFHGGPSGSEDFGNFRSDPETWYEADLIAGLSFNVLDRWTTGLTYTAYTSPNDSFETIQELAWTLAYDDSACWEAAGVSVPGFSGLQPYVIVAFELDDQADAGNSIAGPGFEPPGTDQGVYLELGINPGFTLIDSPTMPVNINFPIKAGFSLSDYYEDPTSTPYGEDSTFGYASVGVLASVPLSMIPADFGSWTLTSGATFMWLGDTTQHLSRANGTGGDGFEVIGVVSLSMSY